MDMSFLLISGIVIVVVLVLVGLVYTFSEFKEMDDHPESYQYDQDEPEVVDKESNSTSKKQ